MRALYAPLMVIIPLVVAGWFSEPDRASTHTLERPPNPVEWHTIKENAPKSEAPSYALRQPLTAGPSAEDVPPAIEPTPEPTPMPLYVAPKLTPAIDALSETQMREWLVAAGAPEEYIAPMIAIGTCESHGSPEAIGDGGNSRGWLQLWTGWFSHAGYSLDQWSDPVVNAAVGVHVREVRGRFGGAGGWSCADHLGIY